MVCLALGIVDKETPIGGHENVLIRLCKALSKRGHQIVIITTPSIHYPNTQRRIIDLDWGAVVSLPMSGTYGSLRYGIEFVVKAHLEAKQWHRKSKFDIIHGHSGYPILGLITGSIGKLLGIPPIHTLYSPIQTSTHAILLNRFYLSLLEVIISSSKKTQASLRNIGISTDKIRLIPPAIDSSLFNPYVSADGVKESLNLVPNDHILLYVGDLTKTRGLHVLIEALNLVLEQFPNTRLLLAVNMPLEKYKAGKFEIKQKISSFGLDDEVIPLGIVSNMHEIMAASDIFIAPYLSIESIADPPISVLEAMACGIPVIATNVGGISDLLTHKVNGLLIEPGNSQELKDAITHILEKRDEAKKIGDNAAKYASEQYSIDAIVEKMEGVYGEVISDYSGNRGC